MTRSLQVLSLAAAVAAACSPAADDSTDVPPRDDGTGETAEDAGETPDDAPGPDADADADDGADADADADAPGPDADADADVATDASCPVVPEPPAVSQQPIPGESPAGRHETTTVNGFQDDYLYDATDYLKIGLRREWGGTIIFFGIARGYGAGVNPTNSIDANDTDRTVRRCVRQGQTGCPFIVIHVCRPSFQHNLGALIALF